MAGSTTARNMVAAGDVIAFRLNAHHLTRRLSVDAMLDAAGRCGVQNSPPGSAQLALHARVEEMSQERMDHAVAEDKSLLQTWCMRGAPFYVPTADASVFTTGVLPTTDSALRQFILGIGQALDKLGVSLARAVELVEAEIRDVLSGTQLAINELGAELAERIAPRLPPAQRGTWTAAGPYAANQPLGEGVVHFCVRILTLKKIVCFAPRSGNKAPFVLVDEWLGHALPDIDPEIARAELLRRYLRAYGPSTRKDFAAWAGVSTSDADPWWSLLEDELTQVDFGGRAWLLTEDLDALRSPPSPRGLRLLPPRDPYLQLRDHDTIVDRRFHREVWKTVGEPGAVLDDGKIVGTWRPRKSGRKLTLTVKSFTPVTATQRDRINNEAEQVASVRGATSVAVDVERW